MYADVIVDISASGVDKSFTYRVPEELEGSLRLGSRVDIPFRTATRTGCVIGLKETADYDPEKIKPVLGLSGKTVPLEDNMIALAAWMKDAYGCTMNQALKTVLPVKKTVRKTRTRVEAVPLPQEQEPYVPVQLSRAQQEAFDCVREEMAGQNRPCLIHGITGSGKTEIYSELIAAMAKEGKQSILLIPEIALTYQNLRRFYQRFGSRVGVINSRLSAGEKYETSEKARRGELDLVIGPRSALFTPFAGLGLIIIDEEHEDAYRSELPPCYDSRDTAARLMKITGCGLVLGSATPSVESYYRAERGAYRLIRLTERAVKGAALPAVHVVDLRNELAEGNKSVFSRLLTEKIEERLAAKEQIMLFLNRRGYAGFVSCRSCGKPLKCPHCDISLTYHREGRLRCHYCGYSIPFPDKCPSCGSPYIAAFGTGTQKVETIVQKAFPEARVLRMDADTTAGKSGHSRILSAFSHEEADILVGTQMIVKGHDFPKVTLVGVLAADISLYAGDYRSAERSFDLLTQAAGRAGRGSRPGEAIIQTYMPEHYAVKAAAAQDYEGFYREEIAFRKLFRYPPTGGMLTAVCLGQSAEEVMLKAEFLKEQLAARFAAYAPEFIGPAEAGITRREDRYRQCFYVKHSSAPVLRAIRDAAAAIIPDELKLDIF